MTLYFDTSALLPYYRQERHSAVVEDLLLAQSGPVLISDFSRVEFASALARWVRMGELDEPQANRVESAFHEDIAGLRFQLVALETSVVERAYHWLLLRRTPLRTLDALQLASAEASGGDLVTLDAQLRDAANYLGVSVLAFP